MTADFITLACPTCGGKLEISPNTTSLKCPNCGNEHLVRHDATNITLESFARCPVCGRNDEVKKVSAILANQTQSMQGVTIEKSSYRDKNGDLHTSSERVPFSGTQSSVLAIKLQPPIQPKARKKFNWATTCLGQVSFLIIFVLPPLIIFNDAENFVFWLLAFLPVLFGVFLFVRYIRLDKKNKKVYSQEVKRVQEQEYPKWQNAVERWKKVYYCFRDDCVFIPGEETYADPGSINEYVYRDV